MAALGIQGVMMYGVIQNIKAVKEGMEEGERFVSQWEEGGDPADIYTMTECSRLPCSLIPTPSCSSKSTNQGWGQWPHFCFLIFLEQIP